jgi:hypothetical protein
LGGGTLPSSPVHFSPSGLASLPLSRDSASRDDPLGTRASGAVETMTIIYLHHFNLTLIVVPFYSSSQWEQIDSDDSNYFNDYLKIKYKCSNDNNFRTKEKTYAYMTKNSKLPVLRTPVLRTRT